MGWILLRAEHESNGKFNCNGKFNGKLNCNCNGNGNGNGNDRGGGDGEPCGVEGAAGAGGGV